MPIQRRVPLLIFAGVTIVMAIVGILAVSGALSWYHKPFAGFLIYEPPYVDSLGIRDWPGKQAGLAYLDRIVSVDYTPIHGGEDLVRIIRQKLPGTLVTYQVESRGKMREVDVPVVLFGLRDFTLVFGITFFCGIALYALGVVVYWLKPNIKSSWVFLGLCFSLGTYIVTAFEIETTYRLWRIHLVGLSFFPVFFMHLGLIFPVERPFLDRFPFIEYLIYLPAVLLAILFQIYKSAYADIIFSGSLPWMPDYHALCAMARIFSLFSALFLFFFLFYTLIRDPSPVARLRARMILFGVAVAFIPPGLAMAAVHYLKVNIPWNFLVFFVIFFPAAIGYSIVRHNLFDADLIIRRTVGYTVATSLVIGIYIVVSFALNVFVGQYQLAQSRMFPILFTVVVILVINPIRDRVQMVVDRLFFRADYDYGAIVDKIGKAMASVVELGQVFRRLSDTLIDDLFIENNAVALLTPAESEYRVQWTGGDRDRKIDGLTISSDNAFMETVRRDKRILTRYDVLEDPRYRSISETGISKFKTLGASLIVPLVFHDKLIGILSLGEKQSGKPFKREDIDLFRTLANQGAVAIENARLFQENLEKQRMEEELNIARELQMSMLPASNPKMEGIEIASISIPAREVGGDFYDFIEMPDRKLGIVIGDVTGKSVSGALIMSATRSIFRMLSEEPTGLEEIMARANRRAKQDIKTGMFIALLYAIVDAEAKTLSLCSAGQTQPVYVNGQTGETVLLETEGETFPLGIIDEVDYKEKRLELKSGDKVVLYTDGIVEAMSPAKEMFGFDRLLDTIKEGAGGEGSAEVLMKTILDRVNAFAGGAEQHDDLTVITICAE